MEIKAQQPLVPYQWGKINAMYRINIAGWNSRCEPAGNTYTHEHKVALGYH